MHSKKGSIGAARWLKALIVALLVCLVAILAVNRGLRRADQKHARFYNAGKTINGFLADYCRSLEAAHQSGDLQAVLDHYSPSYDAPERGQWEWIAVDRPAADATVFERRTVPSREFGPTELAAQLAADLTDYATIEQTICKIDLIEFLDPGRQAGLTVKLIVDATRADGERAQERSFLRWSLVTREGLWKITRDELVEGVLVTGRPSFLELDPRRAGIDFHHQRDPYLERSQLAFGVMPHASGGVSTADYDLDGRPDLLFLDGQQTRLYRHLGLDPEGLPHFVDVTDEAGLGGIDRAHAGLFADFDNDGDRDLFVSRYLAPNLYFRNRGDNVFEEVGVEVGLDDVVPGTSATLLDYDLDGDLDLYLAVYGNAFEASPRLPFYARNGDPNHLYRNDGGHFVDVTETSGTGDRGWSLATTAADFDGDGWPDLAIANDFGRKNLYRNLGPDQDGEVRFAEIAKQAGVLDFSGGMGITAGDFDNDGRADLYTSNINSNQRWFGEEITINQYLRNVFRSRWGLLDIGEYWSLYSLVGDRWTELGKEVGAGNSLFRNLDSARLAFEELDDSHTDRAGWGWGVTFADFDNDTDLDLYAANGWISATPETDL